MKIIGRTAENAFITVIEKEEMIRLMGASQILNEFVCNQIQPQYDPDSSVARHALERGAGSDPDPRTDKRRYKKRKPGKKPGRAAKSSAGKADRWKECTICGNRFRDDSRRNCRKLCYKPACKKAAQARWKKAWARANRPGKQSPGESHIALQPATVDSRVNPASPFLSDEQRAALKAQRLETIKRISKNHQFDA